MRPTPESRQVYQRLAEDLYADTKGISERDGHRSPSFGLLSGDAEARKPLDGEPGSLFDFPEQPTRQRRATHRRRP